MPVRLRALLRPLIASLILALGLSAVPPLASASPVEVRKPLPALAPAGADGLSRALAEGRISEARYALDRARSLFRPAAVEATYGRLTPARQLDATIVLRDLALRVPQLSGAARRTALAVLARPDDPSGGAVGERYTSKDRVKCTTHVCVHWVSKGVHAPPLADGNNNGRPDYVDAAINVMADVWRTEVGGMGYRAPKSDLRSRNHGPNAKIDVYLADVGAIGLYGYCTTDDPNAFSGTYRYYDFSAFCVLDDDFSPRQFSSGAQKREALKVTAAHEFFHAVQFAYDAADDTWFMEGTATWMEDEVYDKIDDNRQYLGTGPLGQPKNPLDKGAPRSYLGVYGTWVVWRFLSDQGSLGGRGIVKATWVKADGSARGPDQYSTQALATALKAKGSSLRVELADFHAAAARPADLLEEGNTYGLYLPKRQTFTVGGAGLGQQSVTIDHLAAKHVALEPAGGLSGSATITVNVNGPKRDRGTEARLVEIPLSGPANVSTISLNADGEGSLEVGFDPGSVKRVMLVLVNAGARFSCWKRTGFSCQGTPLDDNLSFAYSADVTP